jgi:transcriptional regulator with XRE-family HTH domain
VAQNLRRLRQGRGQTQEELADLAGFNRNYIGMIEREEHSPTVDTLEPLSQALHVRPEEFFSHQAEGPAQEWQTKQRMPRRRCELRARMMQQRHPLIFPDLALFSPFSRRLVGVLRSHALLAIELTANHCLKLPSQVRPERCVFCKSTFAT